MVLAGGSGIAWPAAAVMREGVNVRCEVIGREAIATDGLRNGRAQRRYEAHAATEANGF